VGNKKDFSNMMSNYDKIRLTAAEKLFAANEKFRTMIDGKIYKSKLSDNRRRKFQALMGNSCFMKELVHSDFPARDKAGSFFVELMRAHRLKWISKNESKPWKMSRRRYYFLTFCHDHANTSDRKTQFHISSFKQRVDRAVRANHLSGIVAMEIQPIMNYPEHGHGRTLMLNAHAIVWTNEKLDHRTIQKDLNNSCAWNLTFDCAPVEIKLIEDDLFEDPHHIEDVARYLFKMPHDTKNYMRRKDCPDRFKFMSTEKGYRPELALRVFECLSQVNMSQMVFSVGDKGTKICNAWRKEMRAWHKTRMRERPECVLDFDVAKLWKKYRLKNGSKKFEPVQFLNGHHRPVGIRHPKT
jgi:hypothetical protein